MRRLVPAPVLAFLLAPGAGGAQEAELAGVIDLHVHVAPDSRGPRSVNGFEAAQMARRHGVRAILIKNHFTETASQAYLVSEIVPGIDVYGGIVLNRAVGGINPVAVESMASTTGRLGRMVWLPTFDSEHNSPDSDNVAITRNGALLPEVVEVFDVMREYDLALATGHVSPEEALLAIRGARAAGIERIVVTHPASGLVDMSVEMQRAAADLGALLEYTVSAALSPGSFEAFTRQIRDVGLEDVVLTTDYGQVGNPVPADGMRAILPRLRAAGFSQAEIDTMIRQNPARLLGLN
ncbi:MAG: DUF6282 family protein [Gammaproteobacteria bacterium]|nr:DUF6282 family protein [Gammaproteobacteria bacterium]